MSKPTQRRPSPAMIVACLALLVALGGTAAAATLINGKSIKKGTIAGNRLKKNTLTGTQIKESKLAKVPSAAQADAATSATTAASATTATTAVNAARAATTTGLLIFPTQRVAAAADLASAPKIPLASRGPFNFYARCFLAAGSVNAVEYIEVTSGNATFGTEGGDSLSSLTAATPEASRELNTETAGADSIGDNATDSDFRAASTDIAVTGNVGLAMAKQGNPPTGNGPFPAGNACIFGGSVFG